MKIQKRWIEKWEKGILSIVLVEVNHEANSRAMFYDADWEPPEYAHTFEEVKYRVINRIDTQVDELQERITNLQKTRLVVSALEKPLCEAPNENN